MGVYFSFILILSLILAPFFPIYPARPPFLFVMAERARAYFYFRRRVIAAFYRRHNCRI